VFHDELNLAPGKIRLKQGGGHAGHNGLRSIHGHIGEDYARVRLGIGHPGHKDRVAAYVLSDFAKADQDWLDDMMRGIAEGAPMLAAGEGPKFLNAVAQRMAPARPAKPAPAAPAAAEAPAAAKPAPAPEPDTRNPLERLIDRFR
jgi:PTH1 family peptidyl-tRNA hydrolase